MTTPMEKTIKTILAELSHDEYHVIGPDNAVQPLGKSCRYCHQLIEAPGVSLSKLHALDCPLGVINRAVMDTLMDGDEDKKVSHNVPKEMVESFLEELELDPMNSAGDNTVGYGCRYCSATILSEDMPISGLGDHADWCPMGFIIQAVNKALETLGDHVFTSVVTSKPGKTILAPDFGMKPEKPLKGNRLRIMEVLRPQPRPVSVEVISRITVLKEATIRRDLRRLLKDGLVIRIKETGEPVRWSAK